MTDPEEHPTLREADPLTPLMDAIRGGSQSALGQLMDLCWAELVRYAARQLGDVDLARDIVQETLIQVWERRRAWEPRGSARAYLYRIVRNLVIDEKRRQGVRRRWAERQAFAPSPRPATPDEVLDEQLLTEVFETAVAALPDRRREVFELVFQRGLSHADAAAVMGLSVQTVANQMSSALRAVRAAVTDSGALEG
ncbi:MAG: sigma-70 family RNA polymerase sigma factor [Gemmatimonadetes bacterium]|nr:sigma-70 family RNA polymerase sigma factor [Gemmatimonadota bacterium]MYA63216.1 sigma-70 family RNA polymerase sigma factor [Gemmatimonadota bacterium]MYC00175.1 sigma-70 family RNA polymerase sigma factor [Gemmatimonadota bacterium]MYH53281.1 sigma-70 family RNA polymerase sigma factor [Gemmatimonadota bacterium]MYI45184.1 sigma-70 family RNA polymerase sigma factor [Gemmatimonadota bacterium]